MSGDAAGEVLVSSAAGEVPASRAAGEVVAVSGAGDVAPVGRGVAGEVTPVGEGYEALAERLLATGVFADPWVDGRPRFGAEPWTLTASRKDALFRAAEQIAGVYDEACRLVDADDRLIAFLGLTPAQTMMWHASRPFWHVLARADVFWTDEGPVVCELNADTPTGEPEAVLLGEVIGGAGGDPNRALRERWLEAVRMVARGQLGERWPDERPVAAIVYPTELTEDLSVVRLYRRWLEDDGWTVVLGAPTNLTFDADTSAVSLFGEECHLVLRHYKTDWWGERQPVWRDDPPFDDALPLPALVPLLRAPLEGACAVVNPFGAVLAQNKRMMAFFWERLELFSRQAQQVIRRLVPYTVRLESLRPEQLAAERALWVLKSDYGAEGDEVVIGAQTTDEDWQRALALAVPGRWVAQRYFRAHVGPDGGAVNHGVFLVAGQASGLYTRLHHGPIDALALSVATRVVDDASEGMSAP